MLVKSLIERRFWLQLVNSGECVFSWTQLTDNSIHQIQQISIKDNQQQHKKCNIKRNKILKNSEDEDLIKILKKQQICLANYWYERSDCGKISCFKLNVSKKITNHIPLNCIIGAKRILFRVMHWYYKQILEVDPFTIIPKTYAFDNDCSQLVKNFINQIKSKNRVWIVKPGQNTNRGKGIRVMQTKQLISTLLRQKMMKQSQPLVVQEYIKPFLYCGRKFDIRHYVLITSVNGNIRAYWYKQGYIRTSSQKYDIQDLSDQMIHLTNDAIQKKGQKYGKYEPANKLSYKQFQRYLDNTYPHKKYNFQQDIILKMKQITTNMIKASFQYLDPERKQHNFQLYGLDFYVSSKFRPYLIQCNANPCLEINCPILERIIPGAVQHALRIGLDPLLPPPSHYPPTARYLLCDRVIQKIKYELIFDEKAQGHEIRQKTKKCGPVQLNKSMMKPEEDVFDDEGSQYDIKANID